MGNQEIRSVLARASDSGFADAGLLKEIYLPQAISGTNEGQIQAFFEILQKASELNQDERCYLSDTMRNCFPQNSSITFNKFDPKERWDQQARELWQSGFTSWQHNMNAIQSDKNDQIVLSQNRDTSEYEFLFYARCLMLGSNFMLRHVSGQENQDIQTYFRETFDQSSSEYKFNTVAQSAFILILNSMTNFTTYPEYMSNTLDAIIMTTESIDPGALFNHFKEGMQLDLLLKRIRLILQQVIKDTSPEDIRTKCVELLMRIGIIAGNPEDLILAAQYQYEYKIDISKHLGFFLDSNELFKQPKSAEEIPFEITERRRIQDRVSYNNKREDRHGADTKFACNDNYFFSYDEGKGLSRALKTPGGGWEFECFNGSDDIKSLKCVSFLTHNGKLYIRHSGLTEEPFKLINQTDMTINLIADPIRAPEGSTLKFKWTTDETVEKSENEKGNRWMTAAPMASNGRYIYTLVQYRNGDQNSEIKSTSCEVYSLEENNSVIEFVKEIRLTNEAGKPWIGHKGAKENYLNFGMLACNGVYLVWQAAHNVHIFDLENGKKQKKSDAFNGSTWISAYDSATSNFYSADASVYSYWEVWHIKNFAVQKVSDEEEVGLKEFPAIPIVLDEPKNRIRQNVVRIKQPDFQLNLFSNLIGGQFEKEAQLASEKTYEEQRKKANEQYDEEQKNAEIQKVDLTEDGWIYDYTRAIILSYISNEAQIKAFYADNMSEKQLQGSKAIEYFKTKNGISISESTLRSLRCTFEQVLKDYNCETATISERSSLKSLLHIYISHMACLRPLKLSIKQIMKDEELKEHQKLIETIEAIELFEGQKKNPAETEVLSEKHCYQLYIYHLSKKVVSQMKSLLSTQTREQKLDSMLQDLKVFKVSPTLILSENLIRNLKSFQGAAEFAEVFGGQKDVLERMKAIFDEVGSLIKTRLTKLVSEMFKDKSKIEDNNFQGFGSEETFELVQFNFKFIQEALVYYGNQEKAIGENQPKPDAPKDEKAQEDKKAALLSKSIERKERFNVFFYDYMIKACENFKEILRNFSSVILTSDYANFDEAALTAVFKKMHALLFGKNLPLSAIQMFVMTIQLYEVGSTDLDEVAEALRNAVEGLSFYIGNSTTLHYRKPEIMEANKKVVDDLSQAHRLISLGLTKVAARLVNGQDSGKQFDSLAKLKIFDKGIAQQYIPLLSKNCKDEIEGSFKITRDRECQDLAKTDSSKVEYSEDHSQLRMIFLKELEGKQDKDQFAQTKALMTILSNLATESDQRGDEDDENLVLHVFATLLLFKNLIEKFTEARKQVSLDSDYTLSPEDPILKTYTEACKMRDWKRKTNEALQIQLTQEQTEKFKSKENAANPSRPALVNLSLLQKNVVQKLAAKLSVQLLKKAVDNVLKKCDLLLLSETEVAAVKIDVSGMVETNRETNWSTWQPTPIQKRPQVEISEEVLTKQANQRAETEIFQVIQGDFSYEFLQEFIELSQIKGLRRLAGLVMLNKTLSSSSSKVFYDTLHVWEASLRGNKSKMSHYLDGVQGCGARTSNFIRDQFFETIKIITEKLKYETDSQRIVQLLNSLIWDYAPSDLEVIVKESVFRVLSGLDSHCQFNSIYCAWGKEQYNYSIQNLDRSIQEMKTREYSLSARLRQTFDFLAIKVYSVVYNPDEKLHNNSKLRTIGILLMQDIADICKSKLNQHLKMLESTPLKAASERDQDIRFETRSGEVPDSSDSYMVDQCLAFQGKDCVAAIKKQREESQDKLKSKKLNSFIYRMEKQNQLSQSLGSLIAVTFGFSKENDHQAVVDSIISRDWRVINFLMDKGRNDNLAVEEDFDNNVERDPAEEDKVEEDIKLSTMKNSVKEQTDDKEKLDEWLKQLRDSSDCKQSPLSKANLFSQTSIFGFVNMLVLLFSLSESSQKSADFLKRVIQLEHVTTLVRVSVLCSSPIQCLVQRMFQSMLRLSMAKKYLDEAVTAATRIDKTNIVKTIAKVPTCIDMQSSFWQLLFNQIQMTKQAQFNTTDQVELGKPAVVEEITRTFFTIRQKKGEHSEVILSQIEKAMLRIEDRTMTEFTALFQLVPFAHLPFVTTGKRCKDATSGESLICLGYVKSNMTTIYQTGLSLLPQSESQIIGLLISKEGTSEKQVQKSFNVNKLLEVDDDESSEIFDNLSKHEKKTFSIEMAKQSIYMNAAIVTMFFNRMIQKNSFIRQDPSSAIEHQLFQSYTQRGIFRMIQIFDNDYLSMLKQCNLLEGLINFLSKEAAQQIIKPSEPLVSSEILVKLLNQIFVSATHTTRSAGKYSKFLLYIKDQDQKAAFLQRMTDDENSVEFLSMNIVYTCGDDGRTYNKCPNSTQHTLSNKFDDISQSDMSDDLKCGICKNLINQTEKMKQKKTGLLECTECSNSEHYFCNQCLPKPQHNPDHGLEVDIYSECFFRIARHEAILIKSENLATLSEEILGTILMSNVVITDDKLPLLTIFEVLAEKIISDKRWQECATVRFVVVKEDSFNEAKEFLAGKKMSELEETRGSLLTKICKYIDVAKNAINDPKRAKSLVCDFLSNLNASSNEFLEISVPEILRKYCGEIENEEPMVKEREEKNLLVQLQSMSEEKTLSLKVAYTSFSASKVVESIASQFTTPNFMNKFISEGLKIIEEGGVEFFKPYRPNPEADYQRYYESIVFATTNENPGQLQREQLRPTINKINQIVARSIWLLVISNEGYCQDIDARNQINTEAMHKQIFDLIHDSNMAASHQRIFMGDEFAQSVVREQIQKVLKFFDTLPEGAKFRTSFIQDLMRRADLTIDQIKKDNYQELQNYNIKDLRKLSKLQNVLDPNNLLFLSKQIFSNQKYLLPEQKTDMAKLVFDLHLGFAIIFKSEDDYCISQELIKGCSWALHLLVKDYKTFLSKPKDVNSLLQSELIKELFVYMNKAPIVSSKQKQLTEIILQLNMIFTQNRLNNPEDSAPDPPFERTDNVVNMISSYKNLSQGREFTSQIAKIKLMLLLKTKHAGLVREYGETYQTDSQMYKTYFKKTYCNNQRDMLISVDFTSSNNWLSIENTTSKKLIKLNQKLFKQGYSNQMRVPKGETVVIEFPVAVTACNMAGNLKNYCVNTYLTNEDYAEIEGSQQISPIEVYAQHNHAMFIDKEGQVMGIGIRANGDYDNSHIPQLKMIERPENCQGQYLKATTGKFLRLLLTKENKLFVNGKCKNYCAGKTTEVNDYFESFNEITKIYPLSPEEKIVDVAGGRNFIVVVTDKGGIYASGNQLQQKIDDSIMTSTGESNPYKIKMTEGWKATKCWASDQFFNFWVLAEKTDNPNVKKTFSLGGDYDMVGCGDNRGAQTWREMLLPQNTYLKSISSRGQFAFGIDQDDNVWEWGSHGDNEMLDQEKASLEADNRTSHPYKFVWFKNNNKKVIGAVCGLRDVGMILTQDKTTGDLQLYGYSQNPKDGIFGKNATDACGNNQFVLINNLGMNHNDIIHFAATKYASFIITKQEPEKLPSIHDRQPENRGLIHFFKRKNDWCFVTQAELRQKYDQIPDICFATRHPIKNFQDIKDDSSFLPNLEEIKFAGQKNTNSLLDIKTTRSNKPILKDQLLYYAKYFLAGEEQELYASEEEVIEGGNAFDMTPIIFYAMKQKFEPSQLKMIDQKKLFAQSDKEQDELRFSVTNLNLNAEEILKIPVPVAEIYTELHNIKAFDPVQDIELIRAIDYQRLTVFNNVKIETLKDIQFDSRTFALANNSSLWELKPELLAQRASLLILFSQAVSTLIPNTYFELSVETDSISNQLKINRDLMLPSLKKHLFKDQLKDYYDFINITVKLDDFRYSRKMAFEFCELGIKNNPDFIKYSTFGQLFSQCLLQSPDFEMMQNGNGFFALEGIEYQPSDVQEESDYKFIYRTMEKELMSGMIPLFIPCPNGRLRSGLMRDTFRVNPKATLNKYMKCYQFIGSYIARCMVQDHLWFGLTFTNTFWMLLNDEEPTLWQFASEDARLEKRLKKFQSTDSINWPSDEKWVWQDCEDQILPLENGGEDKQVTQENFEQFKQALHKILVNEGQRQMSYVQKGMKITFGEMDIFRGYINWHDMMLMVETVYEKDGNKYNEDRKLSNYSKNIEMIKESCTDYVGCNANDEQIVRFWNIYKDLNPEDMKIFFNFVGGRTRIGDLPHRFHKKLTIRVDPSIPAGDGPKSFRHRFELVLPETYESEEKFRAALFESINEKYGLECDAE